MKLPGSIRFLFPALIAAFCAPAFATVTVVSLTPSVTSPKPIGTSITWTATATDSAAGPLTFQFNITPPNGQLQVIKDFNVGTQSSGTWTSLPFMWVPTGIEGTYKIEVVAKDFATKDSNSLTVSFHVSPLLAETGVNPVVRRTVNPLVALFSAPSCPAGSTMRVSFQPQSGTVPATLTNWVNCHPPYTMTFEVAGMYPRTAYNLFAETNTAGDISDSPTVTFTTGALPKVKFPSFKVVNAASDTTYPLILHNPITFGQQPLFPDVATDLQGNTIWYYPPHDNNILTRPLPGGGFLVIEDSYAWNTITTHGQYLRQIDLAGNIVRETNIGAVQQGLLALGSVDGGPCTVFPNPAPVGSACVGAFHHDAIQTLPNGYIAALVDEEKIFRAGTQGDTSGLPVDIIGDMFVVLDNNLQVVWYWDVFDPAGGGDGYPELPVTRTNPLKETCGGGSSGCPPVFLLSPGNIANLAHDWMHANSLYYWPNDGSSVSQPGDIIISVRNQDSVFKIDYKDGKGSGKILWRMGPPVDGSPSDFTIVNTFNDPWPWFSHQHDVGIENGGAGPMTIFDNGNTRVSPRGLGSNCKPHDCDSRGMAVTFSETSMIVTPVVSFDLGGYSTAMGSAQLLDNGNYFFENPQVFVSAAAAVLGFGQEIGPTPAAPQIGPADILFNLSGPIHYRGWQMQNLYFPPGT